MTKDFEIVIGLEVHVELKTASKLFCSCANKFDLSPNVNICPGCAGFPGILPVLNEEVVELAIKTGLALNFDISEYSRFDRKSYFYPDLPRAYQVSQFNFPICKNGHLDIETAEGLKRISINRAHLEEDAGKLVHQGDITTTSLSYVDLNRCGVPLLEIVSEPDMRSAQEARTYLEKLRTVLLFAGVSDCKMQEGSLRCDANVSVRPWGQSELGTRTEIKNLNSFRALERAIEYEANRHMEAIEDGEELFQETRTWDEDKQMTRSMRTKEDAHDYRYFPDPDLPPIIVSGEWIEKVRAIMPELPAEAQARLKEKSGLSDYDANFLTSSPEYLKFFDACVEIHDDPKTVSNWIMGEFSRLLNQDNIEISEAKISPDKLVALLKMIDQNLISGKMAKTVFEDMFLTGNDPDIIVKEKGMSLISGEDTLLPIIEEIINNNPKVVEDYRNGKGKAMGFFVGQIMKSTKGQADPATVNSLLIKVLNDKN